MDKNLEMAKKIASEVERAGGRAYFVGGCVRDALLGRENKDIDIEVHRVPVETLEGILDALGERISMGASFGVLGLRHYDLDIAMPRAETATGFGHKDFAVSVDPFLGEEKAASRRDFTINALMRDVLTGEILDFFGGRGDLARGLIRHVNDRSFGEDPLRVIRGAQFAARFGFEVAPETRALCVTMRVDALAGDRVMGELEKALLKAAAPSVFFEELRAMRQLHGWFPELEPLIDLPQPPQHHPEGDVWTHTMQVLDAAAKQRAQASEPLYYMLAALCHDLGKAVTTAEVNGKLHALGHKKAGIPIAKRFLRRLTGETKLFEYVLNMTELHMQPNMRAAAGAGDKSFMRLFDASVAPDDLLLLAKADHLGRVGPESDCAQMERDYEKTEKKLRDELMLYRERMAAPHVMGRDLVEAGIQPGPQMGEGLAYAHKLRLAGLGKDEQLHQTLGFLRRNRSSRPGN